MRAFASRAKTDHSADAVEIDHLAREIRGFGLVFRIQYDGNAVPVIMDVSNGSDSVHTQPGGESAASPVERSAMVRLTKNFNDSNGPARVRQFKQLLQSFLSRRGQTGRIAATDALGCIMDIVSVTLDWIGVIGACGAPVVDLFTCVPMIIWATADTIRNAAEMATDCLP